MSASHNSHNPKPALLLPALLILGGVANLIMAESASGWIVSGRISNASGAGIPGVDLDFEDRSTGIIVFTPNDDTDAFGNYSTTVPGGDYRIFVNPPQGSNYFDDQRDVTVASNLVIDFTLTAGVFVSGYVRDSNGVGLLNIDLNFYDAATGANPGYANDNTDASGFYSVLVESNRVFDILYRPSQGDPHVASTAENVSVGLSNLARPPVILESGLFVQGLVVIEGTNNPVQGADIDARNTATGETLSRLGFDNTDGSGGYQVVLKAGTWDILVSPPSGSGLAGDVQPGVAVTGDTFAGTTTLPPGHLVSGTVTNGSGVPLAGANLDAIDLSRGLEVPTAGDHTNASGEYAVLLGAGGYDLIYWPPSGAPLAASVIRNQSISGGTSIPPVRLLPGFLISGTVRTEGGAAVLGSDIDANDLSSGRVYPTAGDDSGAGGAYAIRIPGGSYRFIAKAPAGSGLIPDTLVTTISSNRTIDFSLPVTIATGVPEGDAVPGQRLQLDPVYPNPVRGEAHVIFHLPAGGSGRTMVTIVSASGQHVRTLMDGAAAGNSQHVVWDGRDESGRRAASGLYFVRVNANGSLAARRLIVSR